ncbi:hypothetical protein C900_03176 [Fulvivirga imtechensis AK7]|uniref:Secretion system C-terminal sorting domain-containing protein n=2 Tax=Fulvivirga TaxID=396811 RepID=L8JQ08_9BACT|nr:hypothetical protein C900_03176 [Fulvivirga imtechensis AK7]
MFTALAQAQDVNSYLVSPAGGSFHSNGIKGVWSVGEVTGGTSTVRGVTISQGFVRSNLILTVTSIDTEPAHVYYEIYPNPTQDFLYIKWSNPIGVTDLQYKIYDTRGTLLETLGGEQAQLKQISMSPYVPGIYILVVEGSTMKQPIKLKVTKSLSYE